MAKLDYSAFAPTAPALDFSAFGEVPKPKPVAAPYPKLTLQTVLPTSIPTPSLVSAQSSAPTVAEAYPELKMIPEILANTDLGRRIQEPILQRSSYETAAVTAETATMLLKHLDRTSPENRGPIIDYAKEILQHSFDQVYNAEKDDRPAEETKFDEFLGITGDLSKVASLGVYDWLAEAPLTAISTIKEFRTGKQLDVSKDFPFKQVGGESFAKVGLVETPEIKTYANKARTCVEQGGSVLGCSALVGGSGTLDLLVAGSLARNAFRTVGEGIVASLPKSDYARKRIAAWFNLPENYTAADVQAVQDFIARNYAPNTFSAAEGTRQWARNKQGLEETLAILEELKTSAPTISNLELLARDFGESLLKAAKDDVRNLPAGLSIKDVNDIPADVPKNVRPIVEQALESKKIIDDVADDIAAAVGGTVYKTGVKALAGALEKANADYGGDLSKVRDWARNTIVVPEMADIDKVIDHIDKRMHVVRVKREMDTPLDSGFRRMLVNVELDNGQIAEIQVTLPELFEAKKEKGQDLYRLRRLIERTARTENRPFTDEEKAQFEALINEEREVYVRAFASAMRRSASSGESGRPSSEAPAAEGPEASGSASATPFGKASILPRSKTTSSNSTNLEEESFISEIIPDRKGQSSVETTLSLTPESVTSLYSQGSLSASELKILQDALITGDNITVYIPREVGSTLFRRMPVMLEKPQGQNRFLAGPTVRKFEVAPEDLAFSQDRKALVYMSQEVREGRVGQRAPAREKPEDLTDRRLVEINAQFPEGVDVGAIVEDIQAAAATKFSMEDLANLQVAFSILKETMLEHPARKLAKYANKYNELPDVMGYGKSIFARRGDQIVTELGYATAEDAQKGYKDYLRQVENFKEIQAQIREDVKTARDLKRLQAVRDQIISIAKRAEKTVETAKFETLRNTLRHELTTAKAVRDKQNVLRGRYTPEIQKKLDYIREIVDSSERPSLMAKVLENTQKYGGVEGTPGDIPDEVKAENEILGMAGALVPEYSRQIGIEGMQRIIESVRSVKENGKTLRELKDFNKRTEIERLQAKSVETITGGKGLKSGSAITPEEEDTGWMKMVFGRAVDAYLDAHRGIDAMMEYLSRFDRTSGPFKSFLQRYPEMIWRARNTQSEGTRKWEEAIQAKFGEIYGVKPGTKEFRKKFQEQLKPEKIAEIIDPVSGELIELNMNRFQLRKKWMEWQDPSLRPTFELAMGYTPDVIKKIEAKMSAQDYDFALWQLEKFYPTYYPGVNRVYEDLTGASLGRRDNYSPIKRKVVDVIPEYIQFAQDIVSRATVKPGSIKTRTQNITPIRYEGDFQTMQAHIVAMEHFKAFSQVITDLRRVFSGTVNEAIRQYHYKGAVSTISKFIDDLARDGVDWKNRFEFLDQARGNYAVAVLGANIVQVPKQLSGIVLYMAEPGVSAKDYFRHFFDFWKDAGKNGRELIEASPYLQARYDLGTFDRDVKLAFKDGETSKLSGEASWKSTFMLFTKLGDRLTSLIGGYPIYRITYERLIAEGKSAAEAKSGAVEALEAATRRTQGSGNVEDLGSIQRAGSFGNLFTLFLNNPIAQFRLAEAAVRNLGMFEKVGGGVKRGTTLENLKTLFIIWVVAPALFQFISDGFEVNEKRQARAIALGPLGYPVIMGDLLETIVRKVTGDDVFEDVFTPTGLSALVHAGKTLSQSIGLLDEKTTMEDVFTNIEKLATLAAELKGVPIKPLLTGAKGSYRILTGETMDPRELVYSPYALDVKNKEKEAKKTAAGDISLELDDIAADLEIDLDLGDIEI